MIFIYCELNRSICGNKLWKYKFAKDFNSDSLLMANLCCPQAYFLLGTSSNDNLIMELLRSILHCVSYFLQHILLISVFYLFFWTIHFAENSCRYNFRLVLGVCEIQHGVLFQKTFINTSMAVCFELCSILHDEKCSGIFFDRRINQCTVTSFTGDAWSENEICPENVTTTFFRRVRCTGKQMLLRRISSIAVYYSAIRILNVLANA